MRIKSDTWALAAILLECWTGTPPHGDLSATRTLVQLAANHAPDVKAAVNTSALPLELASILETCFAAAPGDRPSAYAVWLQLCKARKTLLAAPTFSTALYEHWVRSLYPHGKCLMRNAAATYELTNGHISFLAYCDSFNMKTLSVWNCKRQQGSLRVCRTTSRAGQRASRQRAPAVAFPQARMAPSPPPGTRSRSAKRATPIATTRTTRCALLAECTCTSVVR